MKSQLKNADLDPPERPRFIGTIICLVLAMIPAGIVYSECQNMNEFTLIVLSIPILLILLLGVVALILCVMSIVRLAEYREYISDKKLLEEKRKEAEQCVATELDRAGP